MAGSHEVRGSIPLCSTNNEKAAYAAFFGLGTSMCFRAAAGLNVGI